MGSCVSSVFSWDFESGDVRALPVRIITGKSVIILAPEG